MSSINNVSSPYLNPQFGTSMPSHSASISGGILYCETPLEKISAKDFWVLMDTYFDKDWEFLYISPESKVSKERMQLYAKIKLDIPLAELEKIDKNLDLEVLKDLANYEISPIFKAVSLGSISLMQKAIQEGDSIHAFCEKPPFEAETPLSLALFNGQFGAFQWLMDQKADTFNLLFALNRFWSHALKNKDKFIPLFKNSKVLSCLFELEFIKDIDSKCRAQYATEEGDTKVLEFFIASGADIEKLGLIEIAVNEKQIECLKLLLENYTQLSKNKTILKLGFKSGNNEIIELLLIHGALYVPDEKSSLLSHPLYLTSKHADKKIFHLLVKNGCKLDTYNLVYFLFEEYFPQKTEFDYSIRENKKMEKHHLELLSFFVENKALNVNLKNFKGLPLLHALILNDHDEASEIFCKSSEIDLAATDANGMTALHIAVIREKPALVAALLKNKAPVNALTPTLISPLHFAAFSVNLEITDLLINEGANLKTRDYQTKNPYFWALSNKFSESEALIKKLYTEEVQVSPEYAYVCYKRTYNASLKPLFEKIKKSNFSLTCQEEDKKKLAAHVFKHMGESSMILRQEKKETMDTASIVLSSLEASQPKWILMKTTKILRVFEKMDASVKETASFILSALEDFTKATFLSDEEILKQILGKKTIVLELGYWSHSSKILFFEDMLIICDRRGVGKAIEVMKYDPKKLSKEIVSSLRGLKTKSTIHYDKTLSQIKKTLCTANGNFENNLETMCIKALKMQVVANCTYSSLEGICYILWAIHKIKSLSSKEEVFWDKLARETRQEFRRFSFFMELSTFENYLDFHLLDKSLHYPDTQFVHTLMKKIQEIDFDAPRDEPFVSFLLNVDVKYRKFKERFPDIKFTKPLPATNFLAKSLKHTEGKTPSYWIAYKTYADTTCTPW